MAPKKQSPLPAPITGIAPAPVPNTPPGPMAQAPAPVQEAPAPPQAPAPQVQAAAPAPANPNIVARRSDYTRTIQTDRFKLLAAKCKKNRSFRENEAKIEELDHAHFFDSHNRRGEKMTHSEFSCGHKHAISYGTDKAGNILLDSITCGPAMAEASKHTPSGKRLSSLMPVDLGKDPESAEGKRIVDVHIHQVEYMKTEEMEIKQ